jgi:hypothetical protein
MESGRPWYEIWVPHHPEDWSRPKIVFPDIAEHGLFCLDESGAIVNGDCYWITLRPDAHVDYFLLMLAVANSTLITRYYDVVFHNKLYSGRRRFMTQYVNQFPLPDRTSSVAQKLVDAVSTRLSESGAMPKLDTRIDQLTWQAFGFRRPPSVQ